MNNFVGLFSLTLTYLSIHIKKIFKIMSMEPNSYLGKVNFITVYPLAISLRMGHRKETKRRSKAKENATLNNPGTLSATSYSSVELCFTKIQPNKDLCAQGLSLLSTGEKNQYAKSKASTPEVLRIGRREKKLIQLENK